MKPFFIYKGIDSREMGISILKLPPRIKPERRGEIINVPGRDGFLFESDDAYNSKTLEIECTFLPPEDKKQEEIDKLIMEMLVWLDGSGELIFSDYLDYFYEATIINAIPVERLFKRYRRFIITFEVQPFSKKCEWTILDKTTMEEEVVNVSTYYNTPLIIELEANGNVEIHINNTIMHFNNLKSCIVIDGELFNVTDENGVNMNNSMIGDFAIFKPGDNTISVVCDETSSFSKLSIKYRSLWL